jgi:P27 family predicted phage terminase small subunit
LSNRAKPLALIKGNHITKNEREKREKAEASLKGKVEDILIVPSFLDADAKKYYKRTLEIIGPSGTDIICDADKDSLTTYATALSILKKCSKEIKKGILIDGKPNPALKLYENYSKIVKSFSSSFGLDPFSRSKLVPQKEEEKQKKTAAEKRFGDRL